MSKKNTSEKMNTEEFDQEQEVVNEKGAVNDPETTDQDTKKEEEPEEEKDELTVLQEKNEELNDRFLRLYSEFDNFRKRTQKEKIDLYKTAGEDVINSLLPVLDDFERALKSIDQSKDLKDLREGISLIYQKLLTTLNQKGLEPIESSIGKDFDLDLHESVSQVPTDDKKMKGKVIDEIEKGYMLNDKVIRYAKVVIGA
jgi:molecular chaperone GrpE